MTTRIHTMTPRVAAVALAAETAPTHAAARVAVETAETALAAAETAYRETIDAETALAERLEARRRLETAETAYYASRRYAEAVIAREAAASAVSRLYYGAVIGDNRHDAH